MVDSSHPLLGIFGGTFDPVHYGHLNTIDSLQQQFHFDKVLFVPCKQPVYTEQVKSAHATAQQRIDMLQLALADVSYAEVDKREIERDTPSYTILTLESIKQNYPNHQLAFIMGADAYMTLDSWHRAQDIYELAQLIVLPRAQLTIAKKQIILADIPEYDISSTAVRTNLKSGKISQYLPKKVEHYIRTHNIYKN